MTMSDGAQTSCVGPSSVGPSYVQLQEVRAAALAVQGLVAKAAEPHTSGCGANAQADMFPPVHKYLGTQLAKHRLQYMILKYL